MLLISEYFLFFSFNSIYIFHFMLNISLLLFKRGEVLAYLKILDDVKLG